MWTEKLWEAIWRSDTVGVQHALRNGAFVNCVRPHELDHTTPLVKACDVGDDRIVRILLDAGADARWRNWEGRSAMESACSKGHLSIVKMLLNHDKDLLEIADEDGRTPMVVAANRGHVDVVRFLLVRGANIHAATQAGKTALMVA